MYCKKCGAMISSRQSKCEKCGWEVPQNNQEAASSPIEEQALTVPKRQKRPNGAFGAIWQLCPCAVELLHSIKVLIRCSGMIPVIPTLINM